MQKYCMLGICLFLAAAIAVAEQAKKVTYFGKVVDSNGAAVSGVLVQAFCHYIHSGTMVSRHMGEATTKADGAFVFRLPAEHVRHPKGVKIFAMKKGFALGWAMWQLNRDKQITIKLQQPATLSGVIVDEAGKGVQGAEVRAMLAIPQVTSWDVDHYAQIFGQAPFNGLAVKTDARGRFVFINIPLTAKAELRVSGKGRATLVTGNAHRGPRAMQYSAGQADIRIVLPVEARISGVLVNKVDGMPVGGQELHLWFYGRGRSFSRGRCVSAADGTFSVDGLCAGTWGIRPFPPENKLSDWVAAPVSVKTKAGETTDNVEIEFSRGGFLDVIVRDTVTDKVIEGVCVQTEHRRAGQHLETRTDKDGSCRFRLMPGKCRINGRKRGYKRTDRHDALIVEGQTTRQELWLSPFPEVKGVILDLAGKPVSGATVRIGRFGTEDITNKDGKFHVKTSQMSCGEDFQFHLFILHRQRNLASVTAINDGLQMMEIFALPGVTVTGRVVDSEGNPVPAAEIRVAGQAVSIGQSSRDKPVIADDKGSYKLSLLPPGQSFYLSVTAKGYGRIGTEVSLAEKGDEQLQLEDLVIARATLSVSGTVVDEKGKPMTGMLVNVSGRGQQYRTTKTDAQGRFEVDGLCKGEVYVRAQSSDYQISGRVQAEAGAKDVKIVIRQPRYAKPR